MILESVIHHPGGGVSYQFGNEATSWEKEAIREYGVQSKGEVEDALAWREAVDKLEDPVARTIRGKDPSTGEDVGRGRGRGQTNG